ncbi:MAG: helix-turn-helix protein, partial [Marmoricola sp.]|nr:helix-turn-helix protein [Marmoricola sp.]
DTPAREAVAAPVERPRRGVLAGDLRPGGDWRQFPPLVLDTSLAAALSAFSEFGYHGATMRVIAERAGLSVPGLYHHWAGKQELLVALLDLTMDDLTARIEAALVTARDPRTRFAAVVECLALFHTHRRELAFVGASEMRSLEPPARARLAGVRREVQRRVDTEVVAGAARGSFATARPQEAARAVVTMCTAMAQWFRADGAETAEAVAEQYVGFALGLVGAEPDPGEGS